MPLILQKSSVAMQCLLDSNIKKKFSITKNYPLHGYILGVLMHTTAWDRHWGGDETLKLVLVYVVWLLLS